MKKCKTCGKDLIGGEKLFCKSCYSKHKDNTKKVGEKVGVIISIAAIVVKMVKISNCDKKIFRVKIFDNDKRT